MPKIGYISDIHVDHSKLALDGENIDVDIMVVAGDLGVANAEMQERAISTLDALGIPVVVVLGNHDFWSDQKTRTSWEECLSSWRKACEGTNVTLLEREVAVIKGVRFLGCSLWSDYSNDPRLMRTASSVMNDFALMGPVEEFVSGEGREYLLQEEEKLGGKICSFDDWEGKPILHPLMLREIHYRSVAWLRERLDEEFDGPTIVVTHHAPSWESLRRFGVEESAFDEKYWEAGRRGHQGVYRVASYASRTDLLKKAWIWIHGHLHARFSYVEDGCAVFCNPKGYGRHDVFGFESYEVIDLSKHDPAIKVASAMVDGILDGVVDTAEQAQVLLSHSLAVKDKLVSAVCETKAREMIHEVWEKQVEAFKVLSTLDGVGFVFHHPVGTCVPHVGFNNGTRNFRNAASGGLVRQTKSVLKYLSFAEFLIYWSRSAEDRSRLEVPFRSSRLRKLWRVNSRKDGEVHFRHQLRYVHLEDVPEELHEFVVSALGKTYIERYEKERFLEKGEGMKEENWFKFLNGLTFSTSVPGCACMTSLPLF